MGVMDEFREERKKILQGTRKEKWQYFLDYYKGYAIGAVIIVCILITSLVNLANQKEVLLRIVMLNTQITAETYVKDLEKEFLLSKQKDPDIYEISLMTNLKYINESHSFYEENMATMQTISAQVTGGLLDVMFGDLQSMLLFAYGEHFMDLSLVLTEEQMMELRPYLLYMDMATLEKAKTDADIAGQGGEFVIPDCRRPDAMEKPMPVFIDLNGCEKLKNIYPEGENTVVLAVAANAPNEEMLRVWVDFLLE